MIATIMKLSRAIYLPLLIAFTLLLAQQVGAIHSLHHNLEDLTQQRDDKKIPHSVSCEMCAVYAQLGSALSVGSYDFIPLVVSYVKIQYRPFAFRITLVLAATARGPPAQLQRIY